MGKIWQLLVAALTAQSVLASPIRQRSPYAVKERHFLPRRWRQLDRSTDGHFVHLKIGVKQGQFDELERHLYEGEKSAKY